MSTSINVNIDQAPLLQWNREQTNANRLVFLEAQNRKKVEAEARRRLELNRAKDGKDANGNLYNNRLNPPPSRPDPAAWRTSGDLPYFHWKRASDKLSFLSGDGQQALEVPLTISNLEPPLTDLTASIYAQLPPLSQLLPIDSGWSNANSTNRYYVTCGRWLYGPGVYNGPNGESYWKEHFEFYEADRYVSAVNTANRTFIFPLGDNTSLFVLYVSQHWVAGYTQYFERRLRNRFYAGTPENVQFLGDYFYDGVESYSFTWETEISLAARTEIVCVRAGFSVVERIQPPGDLIQAIRALLPPVSTRPRTFYKTQAPCAVTSIAGTCEGFAPNREVSQNGIDISSGAFGDYADPEGSWPNLGYGLTVRGATPQFQSTPAVWFALAAPSNDKWFSQGQHYSTSVDLQPAGDADFALLFPPSKYVGLPLGVTQSGYDLTVPVSLKAYRWASPEYMTGDSTVEAYLYGTSLWANSALSIRSSATANPTPTETWNRTFIYDWGRKAFCQQRRQAYSIDYTPYTP